MKLKILQEKMFLRVLFISFVLFIVFIFSFTFKSNIENVFALSTTNKVNLLSEKEISFGLPLRLKIPKIKVNSSVEYVGLTSVGEMENPKNIKNVAWFKLGVKPGEIGTAVIAGHYGWKNGRASAFDNLYKLKKGDKLFVEDSDGNINNFIVRDIKKYDAKANSDEVFNSFDNKSHLNLITCGGIWNKAEKSYSSRLVIFTDKEEI